MRSCTFLVCCGSLALCGCNRSAEQPRDQQETTNTVTADAIDKKTTSPVEDRTPLSEPNGAIDPKSVEAAGQVVQSYGALMEQQRWDEAKTLWSDPGRAAKLKAELAQLADVHLEIGNLGEPEGAAGSIYVTMPVIFYGDLKNGQPFRRTADVTLRRVNDVPGSTEAQRRWHIETIDWAS